MLDLADDYVPVEHTLLYSFATPLIAEVIRKNIWGSPYVRFPDLISVKFGVFEVGCVIGMSMKAKLRAVVRMLGWAGGYDELLDGLLAEAQIHMAEPLRSTPGVKSESLIDLFLFLDLEAKGSPSDALTRWKNKKIELELAARMTGPSFLLGLGIGAEFTDLFEDLWRETWEKPKSPNWTGAEDKGLPLPAPSAQTFEERRNQVTESVKRIAGAYFSDIQGYVGTTVNEVNSEVTSGGDIRRRITLHDIEEWAFTEDHRQLLCPSCIGKKLADDRLYLVDGQVRDRRGFTVFKPGTELELRELDYLEYLEPLSRAWPRRHLFQPRRPEPTPNKPWRCDSCSLPILTTTSPL